MDVEGVVRSIAEALGDRALFIGGVAVEAYVAYRRTHDVDVIVRAADFHRLRDLLEGQGFRYRESPHLGKHIFKAAERGEVDAYTDKVGDTRVTDLLFGRGKRLRYAGRRVLVAGLEDLLALKLAAGREMDLADVAVLLWERGDEVDHDLVESLA
ncbi:MAG: nucleotidyltransferase, partial [Thermoplasmata archaeon]